MNPTELLTYDALDEKSNPFMRPLSTKASVRYASVSSPDGMMLKEVPLNGKAGDRLLNTILHGDTKEELRKYPDNFVDLIVTSPPYSDRAN